MPRPLVVLGRILIGVIVLVAILLGVLHAVGGSWMRETYHADVAPVVVPADSASIARGKHVYEAIAACAGCHGYDLGGQVLVDSPVFATWLPPNLTSGTGSATNDYTPADWVRAVRHGIDPEGRGLIMMPATGYHHLSDADVGALIAYITGAPPVEREMEPSTLNLMGRVAMVMGGADFVVARTMDHDAPRTPAPEPGVSLAYGDYLTRICAVCHGADLAGDFGPDLRPKGGYAHVDREEFAQILRSGVNAAGQKMDQNDMPWPEFARLTDGELDAIWMYLESLPGR